MKTKLSNWIVLATVPALFSATLCIAGMKSHTEAAPVARVEEVVFEPAYLIVEQVDGAPMATGALDVQEVTFEEELEVRLHRAVPEV